MARKMPKELKIYLRTGKDIPGIKLAERFSRIKEHLGLKNDTEVLRTLINWYWAEHQDVLAAKLEYFNLNDKGVLILDKTINRIVTVTFRDSEVWCDNCQTKDCFHTRFALDQPEIQEVLRKKK